MTSWNAGAVYSASWLHKRGYSYPLLSQYRQAGWLAGIGSGALVRCGDKVEWTGGVYALQEQLNLKIHVAGKTALALQGSAHFLGLGRSTVSLYGTKGQKLPAWFAKHEWNTEVRYVSSNLFGDDSQSGMTKYDAGNFTVKMSAPERAILEVLHLVPEEESFEQARLLLQGLTTLRPDLVHKLLVACTSIKVRRLFMALSEELELPWTKKVDFDSIDIGKGARCLLKGGKTHPKYQITLPLDCFAPAPKRSIR